MKKLKIFNTLSDKVEEFQAIDPTSIKLYSCGLTVYDYAHIGHARTTILVDVLVKLLKVLYKKVVYVRNITDVDDKIIKRAEENGITTRDLTNKIIKSCNDSMLYINNNAPDFEPKVTDNIENIIQFIKRIIDNGHAYATGDGNVFFDVNSYKDYGILSHTNTKNLLNGVRIENNDNKRNPLDFALWKPSLDTDDEFVKFNSPWGSGRPGWHIECSAMSYKYLGENFDIHCGGMDLKFPHHENEIAQSRCAFKGSDFAKYWFHTGFLMVNGEKMSKSLGNFVLINSLKEKGLCGAILRFTMLKNHYRKPLDFNDRLIMEAKTNLENLHKNLLDLDINDNIDDIEELIDILCDDLNTPKAITLLNNYNKNHEYKKLKASLNFLGIFDKNIFLRKNSNKNSIDESKINKLVEARIEAKKNKDWITADKIREELNDIGVILMDNKDGTTTWRLTE